MPTISTSARHGQGHWSIGLAGALGLVVLVLMALWWWLKPIRSAPAHGAAASVAEPSSVAASGAGAGDAAVAPSALILAPKERRAAVNSGEWGRLGEGQRMVLAPLEDDWADLTKDQRTKWLDLAQRFPTMLPDEQQRVRARMAEWARMSPADRGLARLNFQETRQLSVKERLERWEAYQELDAGERKQLAEKGQTSAPAGLSGRRLEPGQATPKSSSAVNEAMTAQTPSPRAVSATVVQAPMGATTQMVSRWSSPPAPVSGPKIAATPEFVDPTTLLPQVRAARIPTTPPSAEPTPTADNPTEPPSGDSPPTSGG